LRTTPVTRAELVSFANLNAVNATTSLQSRAARSDTLAQGELWARDAGAYAKQITQGASLTPAALMRAVQRYLTPGRVVFSMVPAGKLDQISKPGVPFVNVSPPPARSPAGPSPERR
jgi:hypothetical protein